MRPHLSAPPNPNEEQIGNFLRARLPPTDAAPEGMCKKRKVNQSENETGG